MKIFKRTACFCISICLLSLFAACVLPNSNEWNGTEGAEGLAVPANLNAMGMSGTSVFLTWDEVAGVESYAVYSALSKNGEYTFVNKTEECSFTNAGLKPETLYYYKVAAVSADGTGPLSEPQQALTLEDTAKPLLPPPQGINVLGLTPKSVQISWHSVSGGKYNLYRAGSPAGEKIKVNDTPFEETKVTHIDAGLMPSTIYYYFLVTVNSEDRDGPFSAALPVSTPSNTDPSIPVPANLQAVPETYQSIQISWNPVSGAAKYNLYVSSTSDGGYVLLSSDTSTFYLHYDENFSPNTTRYYKVSAVGNSERESYLSAVKSGTTKLVPVPAGLSTNALSPAEIRLTWTPVADAASYKIYHSVSATENFEPLASAESASYTHSGLGQNSVHYYKVSAVVNTWEGKQSAAISGTTSQVPVPSGLVTESKSYTEIGLTWTPVADAASYKIYHSVSSTGNFEPLATVESASYTHDGLSQNTTHYYKVSAVVSGFDSNLSAAESGTTKKVPVPSGLTAEALSPDEIYLTWNSVPDAASYNIYQSVSSSGNFALLASTESASYTHDGLSQNTTRYYKVSAVVGGFESDLSAVVSGTTKQVPVPSGLSAAALSSTEIRLEWNSVAEASSYNVWGSSSAAGTYEPLATVYSPAYTHSGLSGGMTVYYKVSALVDGFESGFSVYANATTAPALLPPSGINASALGTGSIQVSWSSASGATSYKIYRSESYSGSYTFRGSSASSPYTDTGLAMGTTYYYKVSSLRGGTDESGMSNIVQATTNDDSGGTIDYPPTTPTGLVASSVSPGSITLTWNSVPTAASYSVYRSNVLNGPESTIATNVTGTSYTDNVNVSVGVSYFYRILAVNNSGESPKSAGAFGYAASHQNIPDSTNIQTFSVGAGGKQYYRLVVTAGATYTIEWQDGNNQDTPYNLAVAAYQNNGTQIFNRGGWSHGYTNPAIFTATATGFVTIEVFNNTSSNQNYQIYNY